MHVAMFFADGHGSAAQVVPPAACVCPLRDLHLPSHPLFVTMTDGYGDAAPEGVAPGSELEVEVKLEAIHEVRWYL